MGVHETIESYQRSVQQVLDVEKRQEASRFLPGLAESVNRLSTLVRDARSRLLPWDDIYALPSLPETEATWGATCKLMAALGHSSAILAIPATTVSQLQNQAAEASTLWQQARVALDTHLREHREAWERELALLDGIAEIPDLLNSDEHEEVRALTNGIRVLLRLELSGQSSVAIAHYASDWRQKTERFQAVKKRLSFEAIGERYGLSPESIELLQGLTGRKRISLAQVSPKTLEELQRFQKFCEAVTLHFSARA